MCWARSLASCCACCADGAIQIEHRTMDADASPTPNARFLIRFFLPVVGTRATSRGMGRSPTGYDGPNRGDRHMKSGRTSVVVLAAALGFGLSAPVTAQWVKYQAPGIPRT